jgi:hypothetical protein
MRGLDRRALVALGTTVILVVVMVPLAAGREETFDTVFYTTLPLTLAAVGTLIASRHPENPIGWLFCAMGVWGAAMELGEAYGYVAADHGLPGGAVGEWLISWSWIVEIMSWLVVVLLFPDGRLPARRWRFALWSGLAGSALVFIGQAFSTDIADGFSSGRNPVGIDSPAIGVAWPLGTALLVAALIAAVVSSVQRFRRARGVEREQLKWFAYGGVVLAVVMPLGGVFWYRSVLVQVLVALALNAMPLAVGVAILRYRLYDVNVLINRTLVYGALTATLAGAYVGSVLVLQLVLSPGSDLAIAGSTLAVAALFRPARRRIQELVDRRFYRSRYDAARTLESFSVRLRDEVDLDALDGELRAVLADTVQPAHVSLWLREGAAT